MTGSKLLPDSLTHDFHRLIERHGAPVLAVRSERIETIHGRENAGTDGNLFAGKAERIAGTVPLFVVRAHDRHDRIGKLDFFQNLGAHQRVDLHLFELFRSQFAGLGNDVFGNGEFADIVQQRGGLERFEIVLPPCRSLSLSRLA